MTFMLLETGLRSEPSGKNCFDMLVYSCTDQNLKMLSVAIQILFTVWYIYKPLNLTIRGEPPTLTYSYEYDNHYWNDPNDS